MKQMGTWCPAGRPRHWARAGLYRTAWGSKPQKQMAQIQALGHLHGRYAGLYLGVHGLVGMHVHGHHHRGPLEQGVRSLGAQLAEQAKGRQVIPPSLVSRVQGWAASALGF